MTKILQGPLPTNENNYYAAVVGRVNKALSQGKNISLIFERTNDHWGFLFVQIENGAVQQLSKKKVRS
jgi:hypothetical protein